MEDGNFLFKKKKGPNGKTASSVSLTGLAKS
jgi:hypothetical protein